MKRVILALKTVYPQQGYQEAAFAELSHGRAAKHTW